MRRRRSTSASCETSILNGRTVLPSPTAASCPGRRLMALAAAEAARTSRRVGDAADMTFSFVGVSDHNRRWRRKLALRGPEAWRNGLAERESKNLHARTEKLDLELAIGDRLR